MEHFLIMMSTQTFSHGGECTMPDQALRYDWLEGSQNAHTRSSFPGEIRFGYKARPWSVPTQMQEVDLQDLAGNIN